MSKRTTICVPCRNVQRDGQTCALCREPLTSMGWRWRAPKKDDDRAWALIAAGVLLWDRKAMSRD